MLELISPGYRASGRACPYLRLRNPCRERPSARPPGHGSERRSGSKEKRELMDDLDRIRRHHEMAGKLRIRALTVGSARKKARLLRKADRQSARARALETQYRLRYGHGPFEIGGTADASPRRRHNRE